jgi:hypothetical protein
MHTEIAMASTAAIRARVGLSPSGALAGLALLARRAAVKDSAAGAVVAPAVEADS